MGHRKNHGKQRRCVCNKEEGSEHITPGNEVNKVIMNQTNTMWINEENVGWKLKECTSWIRT